MSLPNRAAVEDCLAMLAELNALELVLHESNVDSDEERNMCLAMDEVGNRLDAILDLDAGASGAARALSEEVFLAAAGHAQAAVREGLTTYMDTRIGFGCDLTNPGPHTLQFALACHGAFGGAATPGPLDDVAPLQMWLAQRLMLPIERLYVHPTPSFPDLCHSTYENVLHELACANPADASAVADNEWTAFPGGEVAAAEVVLFWVTATLDDASQVARVASLVSEGGVPRNPVAIELPFTMCGVPHKAIIGPFAMGWPMSAMTELVFDFLNLALDEAIEQLQERGIPASELVAELRVYAPADGEVVDSFFVELQDAHTCVVRATVPGLDAVWARAFMPVLEEMAQEYGLKKAFTRLFWQD